MAKETMTQTLRPGVRLKSKDRIYEIVRVLGSGSFGITYLATAKVSIGNISTTMEFAIKEHFMSASCYRGEDGATVLTVPTAKSDVVDSRADFITEANRLKKLCLKSRNIVSVNETFEANGTAYYVMEFLDGGSPSKCSEDDAVSIVMQVADALDKIHKEHVLHLDLKPDNIVFKTNEKKETYPVLIDFGISKHFNSKGRPTSRLGAKGATPGYAPQEQHADITDFSPKYDIYALGAVLFYLCTGKNPPDAFKISPNQQELKKELAGKVSSKVETTILNAMKPAALERTSSIKQFCDDLMGIDFETELNVADLQLDFNKHEHSESVKSNINIMDSVDDNWHNVSKTDNNNTTPFSRKYQNRDFLTVLKSFVYKNRTRNLGRDYSIHDYAIIEMQASKAGFCVWKKSIFPVIIVGQQHYDSTFDGGDFCNHICEKLDKFKSKRPKAIMSFIITTLENFSKEVVLDNKNYQEFSMALLCLTDKGAICINNGLTKIFQVRNGKILYEANDQTECTYSEISGSISEENKIVHPSRNFTTSVIGGSLRSLGFYSKIVSYKRGDRFILLSGEGRNAFTTSGWHKILSSLCFNSTNACSLQNDFETINAMVSHRTDISDSQIGYGLSIVTTTKSQS